MTTFGRIARPREILLDPHPALRRTAKKMTAAELRDPLVQQLIDDLFATVYARRLIGMAAPQIGVNKRLFVVHFEDETGAYGPFVVANPRLTRTSGEIVWTEGSPCIPERSCEVTRAAEVTCRGLDRAGAPVVIEATGLLAVCIQHEIDHLDGILCFDRAGTTAADAAGQATGSGSGSAAV